MEEGADSLLLELILKKADRGLEKQVSWFDVVKERARERIKGSADNNQKARQDYAAIGSDK